MTLAHFHLREMGCWCSQTCSCSLSLYPWITAHLFQQRCDDKMEIRCECLALPVHLAPARPASNHLCFDILSQSHLVSSRARTAAARSWRSYLIHIIAIQAAVPDKEVTQTSTIRENEPWVFMSGTCGQFCKRSGSVCQCAVWRTVSEISTVSHVTHETLRQVACTPACELTSLLSF